jgi:tungstate transport system permease protein
MNYIVEGISQACHLLLSGNAEVYSAVFTTLKVSTISIILSVLIGIPLGFRLGYSKFRSAKIIKVIMNILLSMPTVVIGLLVYSFISAQGVLGSLHLLFSIKAIIVGQTILALPIIIALTSNAVENIDEKLKLTLMTLGARGVQIKKTLLYESRYAVFAAATVAYGRVMSEIGISMMVGGNIKWHTRTITTAIAFETGKGEFALGVALGIVLLLFATVINVIAVVCKERFII